MCGYNSLNYKHYYCLGKKTLNNYTIMNYKLYFEKLFLYIFGMYNKLN